MTLRTGAIERDRARHMLAAPRALEHLPKAGHVDGLRFPWSVPTAWTPLAIVFARRLALAIVFAFAILVLVSPLAILPIHGLLGCLPPA